MQGFFSIAIYSLMRDKFLKFHNFSLYLEMPLSAEIEQLIKPMYQVLGIKRIHPKRAMAFRILLANCLNLSSGQMLQVAVNRNINYQRDNEKISARYFRDVIKYWKACDLIDFYPGYKAGSTKVISKLSLKPLFFDFYPKKFLKEVVVTTPLVVLKDKNKEVFESKTKGYHLDWFRDYQGLLKKSYLSLDQEQIKNPQLYRVYNVHYRKGGRFYGAIFQNTPKRDRKRIKIDGDEVVEYDYQCLHIHLLYLHIGKKLQGDAYSIPGMPSSLRQLVKYSLMIVINSQSRQTAIKAVRLKAIKEKKKVSAEEIISAIEARHPEIKSFFYQPVWAGKLQFIESSIAASILKKFTAKKILVLPIHDGFIIQKKHAKKLRKVMQDTFLKKTKASFKIPIILQ